MYKFNIKTMTTKEELEWLDFKKSLVHFFPGGIELKIKTDINFSNNYEPKVFSNINKEQLIILLQIVTFHELEPPKCAFSALFGLHWASRKCVLFQHSFPSNSN